jgi:hypothetical protein
VGNVVAAEEELARVGGPPITDGYRVVSSREYERSALGITYFKVTYELVEPRE